MLTLYIVNNNVKQRRAALIQKTSLEISKQKKKNEIVRIGGRSFAKRFGSFLVNKTLIDSKTFIIAIKKVELSSNSALFFRELRERGVCFASVSPLSNIRWLYASLATESLPVWLIPHLSSASTYLCVIETFDEYLNAVRACIEVELKSGVNFLEILFLKEAQHFINFSFHSNKHEAAELRKLYTSHNANTILLELNSCITAISVTLPGIFSISLLGPAGVIYPNNP